jgi:hypothetical protein
MKYLRYKFNQRTTSQKLLLFIVVAAFFAMTVNAQQTATASGVQVKANLLKPINITSNQGIKFGTIAVGNGSGNQTIIIDPKSEPSFKSSDADASLMNAEVNPQKAAYFSVAGHAGKTYSITLPTDVKTMAANVTVSDFSCSYSTKTSLLSGESGVGTDGFYVGATLNYLASAATGVELSTNFEVTVAYN